MKQLLTYILSAFFLFAGTGMNVVHYCCDHCRQAGIEHVTEESCELVHEESEDGCCRHHHHTSDCHHQNSCWFVHLAVNQGGISSSMQTPAAEQLQLFHSLYVLASSESPLASCPSAIHSGRDDPGQSPVPLDGRIVLNRDCRLAI